MLRKSPVGVLEKKVKIFLDNLCNSVIFCFFLKQLKVFTAMWLVIATLTYCRAPRPVPDPSHTCPIPVPYLSLTHPTPVPYPSGLPRPLKGTGTDTIFDFSHHHPPPTRKLFRSLCSSLTRSFHLPYLSLTPPPYPFLSLPVPCPSHTSPLPP